MVAFNLQGLWGAHRDFARSYLFECTIEGFKGNNHAHLVKATSLPERTINQLTTDWQGNTYKIGGTSEYSDFIITFNMDAKGDLRRDFLIWMDNIHDPESNVHGSPETNTNGGYFRDVTLKHLNGQPSNDGIGNSIMTYRLIDAWPTSVGEVSLDYSTKEIATFDVSFAYQYHKIE